MYFLNPALLAGTLLFAVPLIIHLLNRQRHKKRPWAAMDFLLRAYQKTRNRLRNENLLLLLLRCLIPIALALAIARPVLTRAAALLGQEGGVHHIAVLDASYSMGFQQDGGPSSFERGRTQINRLLDRLAAQQDRSERLTLVLAGVRPRFLVRSELNLSLARAQWLEVTRPEDAASDLAEAVAQVAAAVEAADDPLVEVYLVTDLQRRALGRALAAAEAPAAAPGKPPAGDAGEPLFQDTLRDLVERLQQREGTQVHLIDVGPFAAERSGGLAENVQLTGLRAEQPVAVARVPVTLVATLKNQGSASAQAQVTLEIDGGEPMRKQVALEPGAEGEAEFQVVFRELGSRRLRAFLPGDGLDADDEWFATIEVRQRIRVLVVDGSADTDPLRRHAFFFRSFLDPQGGEGPPDVTQFEVEVKEPLDLLLGQVVPSNFDVTVLADVDRLNDRATAALLQALQAGRGLLVAFGEHTDPDSFNLQLHQAGAGPQPFRLLRRAYAETGRGSNVARSPAIADRNHAALREFEEDVYREILQVIPIYNWYLTDPATLAEDAQAPLRIADAAQSPLLVTRTFGEGKVAFLTSAPGSEFQPTPWNRLDDPLVAYLWLHGLIKWLALPAQDPFNVEVGSPLTCSVPARPADVEIVLPERAGGGKTPVPGEPRPLSGGRYALQQFPGTTMAGFYGCELMLERDTGREPWSQTFAVHVDPAEGVLQFAAHDEVRTALSLERIETSLQSESAGGGEVGQNEFGPSLLLLTLLLVIGESALARHVSVRRS